MDYEELLEIVKKRRSVRKFRPDPIPNEEIEKIIEVARWAPSGFNSQPWEYVVIKKENLKNEIYNIMRDASPRFYAKDSHPTKNTSKPRSLEKLMTTAKRDNRTMLNASAYIILFGDLRCRAALPMRHDVKGEQMFLTVFNESLTNTFVYMHLAASTLGLATQWITGIKAPSIQEKVKDLLGIPKELVASNMMVLGYPGAKPRPKLIRPLKRMLHFDDCGIDDFRTTEEVNDFAKRTKSWTIAQHRREQMRK